MTCQNSCKVGASRRTRRSPHSSPSRRNVSCNQTSQPTGWRTGHQRIAALAVDSPLCRRAHTPSQAHLQPHACLRGTLTGHQPQTMRYARACCQTAHREAWPTGPQPPTCVPSHSTPTSCTHTHYSTTPQRLERSTRTKKPPPPNATTCLPLLDTGSLPPLLDRHTLSALPASLPALLPSLSNLPSPPPAHNLTTRSAPAPSSKRPPPPHTGTHTNRFGGAPPELTAC